jgi:GNAT superfamily N-acetyltransferase
MGQSQDAEPMAGGLISQLTSKRMKPMPDHADVVFTWRGAFDNAEVNCLHAECFEHPVLDIDWRARLQDHSLGWVCARRDRELVGFVNVAWDGGGHAFVLDTLVVASVRRVAIGTQLLATAACEARAAGCEWLHVDFEDHLRGFYLDAYGFREAPAGVLQL